MSQLPAPKNYRDTSDFFVGIAFNAPDFKNSPLKVPVTLNGQIARLDAGVVGVASRIKNLEAQVLFEKCRKEVKEAHQLYKENKVQEGKLRILLAWDTFKKAAKLKSGKGDKRDDDLVEDDGQSKYP